MRFFSTTLVIKACGVSEGGRDDNGVEGGKL